MGDGFGRVRADTAQLGQRGSDPCQKCLSGMAARVTCADKRTAVICSVICGQDEPSSPNAAACCTPFW